MDWLREKLRRFNNNRRQIVIHDFKHLNCGDCQEYRVNHYSRIIRNVILTSVSFTLLMVIGAWLIHTLFFVPLIIYWAFIWGAMEWYNFPPHRRRFLKLLIKFGRRRSVI